MMCTGDYRKGYERGPVKVKYHRKEVRRRKEERSRVPRQSLCEYSRDNFLSLRDVEPRERASAAAAIRQYSVL